MVWPVGWPESKVEVIDLAEFLNCVVVMPVQTLVEEGEEEGGMWKVGPVDYMHCPDLTCCFTDL